jgi:hypothetical protein
VLFLLLDGVVKVMKIDPVIDSFTQLGYPASVALGIGLVEIICVMVYLIPRTSAVGAVLLTGYLGGAIATHLRMLDPLFTHTFFPLYVAALIWGGLFLRDDRVRALNPLKSQVTIQPR